MDREEGAAGALDGRGAELGRTDAIPVGERLLDEGGAGRDELGACECELVFDGTGVGAKLFDELVRAGAAEFGWTSSLVAAGFDADSPEVARVAPDAALDLECAGVVAVKAGVLLEGLLLEGVSLDSVSLDGALIAAVVCALASVIVAPASFDVALIVRASPVMRGVAVTDSIPRFVESELDLLAWDPPSAGLLASDSLGSSVRSADLASRVSSASPPQSSSISSVVGMSDCRGGTNDARAELSALDEGSAAPLTAGVGSAA